MRVGVMPPLCLFVSYYKWPLMRRLLPSICSTFCRACGTLVWRWKRPWTSPMMPPLCLSTTYYKWRLSRTLVPSISVTIVLSRKRRGNIPECARRTCAHLRIYIVASIQSLLSPAELRPACAEQNLRLQQNEQHAGNHAPAASARRWWSSPSYCASSIGRQASTETGTMGMGVIVVRVVFGREHRGAAAVQARLLLL
jgi:hypothetical protein